MNYSLETDAGCPSAMAIHRAGTGITPAPEGIASGPFLVQMLLSSKTEGETTAMRAFFEPGVATHWHSHPRGQLLYVLDGIALVQRDGDAVIELFPGDAVWFPPNERHWHGAAPISPLSYLSIQGVQDGTAVSWMEPIERKLI